MAFSEQTTHCMGDLYEEVCEVVDNKRRRTKRTRGRMRIPDTEMRSSNNPHTVLAPPAHSLHISAYAIHERLRGRRFRRLGVGGTTPTMSPTGLALNGLALSMNIGRTQ